MESVKGRKFFRDPNLSVDEVYAVLHMLSDLDEQIWTATKDPCCPSEVKAFVSQTSRVHSALNRLGSFVTWAVPDSDLADLAERGFYYKENQTLVQVENRQIEL